MFNKGQELLGLNKVSEKVTRIGQKKHIDYNKEANIINKDFMQPELEMLKDINYLNNAYSKAIDFVINLDKDYQEKLDSKSKKILYLNSEISKLEKDIKHLKQLEQSYISYITELEDKLEKFNRKKTVTDEQQQRIKDKVSNGLSYREIAKEEGVSIYTISKIINNKY